MSRFLLQLNFLPTGCTDSRIANVGEVNFETESAIRKENQRSAYFPPYTCAGLRYYDNNADIKTLFEDPNKEFSIYFFYKIDRRNMRNDTIAPLISYADDSDRVCHPFLYIKNRKWMVLDINLDTKDQLYTRDISYTFDNLWHHCYISRRNLVYSIYIDGVKITETKTDNTLVFGESLYVGIYFPNADYKQTATFNSGSIDDFCITDKLVYPENFVPSTLYWKGEDTADNYEYNSRHNIKNLDPDIGLQVEKNRIHSIQLIDQNQMGNIPYRMKIEWYTDNKYFINNEELIRLHGKRDYTVLRIFLVENIHMFTSNTDRFGEFDALTEVSVKRTMWPFVLFVNKCFIPLSRITIVKSDYWYTFIIKGLSSEVKVTNVEMLFIPFMCLYEEYRGERPDKQVLYSFKENGKFSNDGADFFYYIDDKYNPGLKSTGSIEQYIDPNLLETNQTGNITIDDKMLMHYSWRYGNFETKRVDGSSTYVYFMAWDNGWIKPGDVVMIYKGNTLIDPSNYRIVGYDLIEFYNYNTLGLEDRLITMCIITDCRTDGWLFEDFTDTKIVQVTATQNEQSVFKIPDLDDGTGIVYDKFLVFKGSVCLENDKRYVIDYDKGTITLLSSSDWMTIGRSLTFIFARINKADEYGPLWLKPIFYNFSIGNGSSSIITDFDLPNVYNIKFNMNNVMLFNHNTLITPQRYRIENNHVYFVHPNDGLLDGASITLVILKMASQLEKDNIRNRTLLDLYRKGRRFCMYNLGIDKKRKLTLENITAFDQNGEYIPDLFGYIYNMNVIKQLYTSTPSSRIVRYINIVYHDWSEDNYANITLPENESFIKQYLCMFTEFEELDKKFYEFISEYEDKNRYHMHNPPMHRIQWQYGVNLAKELDYQIYYNQSRFDEVYERKQTVTRKTFNRNTLNNALTKVGTRYQITIPQNTKWFINNIYNTYSLFFRNGYLIDHADCVSYLGNECTLSLQSKLSAGEWMESIDCHKQLNRCEELPISIRSFSYPSNIDYFPEPYTPTGTKVFKDIKNTIHVPGWYEGNEGGSLSISLTVKDIGSDIIAVNELPADKIAGFDINLHTAKDVEYNPLDISIETWTDPPPYIPPAGYKGPEYYDIYMKLIVTN